MHALRGEAVAATPFLTTLSLNPPHPDNRMQYFLIQFGFYDGNRFLNRHCVWMAGAENFYTNRLGFLEHVECLSIITLAFVNMSNIIVGCRGIGVLLS